MRELLWNITTEDIVKRTHVLCYNITVFIIHPFLFYVMMIIWNVILLPGGVAVLLNNEATLVKSIVP